MCASLRVSEGDILIGFHLTLYSKIRLERFSLILHEHTISNYKNDTTYSVATEI